MGHGAPRELGGNEAPLKPLDEQKANKLEEALKKFDALDPQFKTSREDERHQQLSKAWNNRCADMVEELRAIGKAIVASHQILLDMSQDGAGIGAAPWIEEGGMKFERMHIRNKNGPVIAECGQHVIARAPNMQAADYAWLEAAVVDWIVYSVAQKT